MCEEKLFCDPGSKATVLPKDEGLVVESHGSKLFGRLLLPAFDDLDSTCSLVLMLHGYPGVEQNIDIAQLLRMAGYAVVHFSYRGVWGSHGEYCLSHLIEDTFAVMSYIRERASAWRVHPEKIYLLGHSMGGFAAVNAMASGLKVNGAVLMAPCNISHKYLFNKPAFEILMRCQDDGYFHTPSRDFIENDVREHAEQWLFENAAEKLDTNIFYGFICGATDGSTPPDVHIYPLLEKLRERGAKVHYTEICDGHTFPANRFRLAAQIVSYLKEMELA